MTVNDVEVLVCPLCRGALRSRCTTVHGELDSGSLTCQQCGRTWPVRDGLPRFVDEATVRRPDRCMRLIYDWFAPLHDPAVRFVLPLLQGGSERALRGAYMERLELRGLRPAAGRTVVRILEVGIGCGANLPLINDAIPREIPVEVWGLDLSDGMLRRCRTVAAAHPHLRVRLMTADAHALPLADGAFDRVFHVGGIAAFGDPARALREMARVARARTPIVVVDEQLAPEALRSPFYRLGYAALTALMPWDGSPRIHLPASAYGVRDEQISRFYYSLSFRMPPKRRGRES